MYDSIAALVRQEGWRAEGDAARVHYEGGDERFAIEYYAGSDTVLYWTVPTDPDVRDGTDTNADAGTAEPVPRASVPDPLRERIRRDLVAADVDPAAERREI